MLLSNSQNDQPQSLETKATVTVFPRRNVAKSMSSPNQINTQDSDKQEGRLTLSLVNLKHN